MTFIGQQTPCSSPVHRQSATTARSRRPTTSSCRPFRL